MVARRKEPWEVGAGNGRDCRRIWPALDNAMTAAGSTRRNYRRALSDDWTVGRTTDRGRTTYRGGGFSSSVINVRCVCGQKGKTEDRIAY